MSTTSEIHLQLSIWRPASLDRNYLYGTSVDAMNNIFTPVDDALILEQIYSWDSGPNDILGASSLEVCRHIKQGLIEQFTSEITPEERSVTKFYDVVISILNSDDVQSGTYWSDCQETIKIENDDEINVRANVTLTMLRHFHWVARVYLEVPRASVLIR